MKLTHILSPIMLAATFNGYAVGNEPDLNAYLMVYHKDQDHGLHMAVSADGYTWTALNNDRPVIAGDTIAEQHGIRDPHIFRGPDGAFYLAMTDLHVFGQRDGFRDTEWERDGGKYGWGNNRGLVLMKSSDLINWSRANIDFSRLSPQTDIDWSEVGCVWAPETVYDYDTGQLMIHFTTRQGVGKNVIYYVYVNDDFNALTSTPMLLAEAPDRAYNIIDSDIIRVGDTYHLFYVSHEHGATPKHATSKKLTGPYTFDENYSDGERQGHEAPNCWKRHDSDTYVVMYDNYRRSPMNFGFVETSDFVNYTPIGYFDDPASPMKRTNFSEQKHGAVISISTDELRHLEQYWKDHPSFDVPVSEEHEKMMTGIYEPNWESLSHYEVPDWFRDAKFGIWAHWGPQCVEGSGDWMARSMYIEDSYQYKHHLEHYGHPSEFGFKDILPLFKAERWNPDSLVKLYKDAGARYFFALGNHHDNFDLWDSRYQEWNSKAIGPEKDILAGWAEACRKNGMPFGVSLHADHAWSWYEPSRRYDRKGEKMGVPYDGTMTKADGKGKWWEGLDPQNLYAQNHPASYGSWADGMIHRQWDWSNDVAVPTREYCTNFYDRTLDVINRYNPDLLYFDVTGVPFYPVSDAGLKIAAHFYNHNLAKNGEKEFSAVIFGKILNDRQKDALVWDVERGAPNAIADIPWQTCTCIGDWHYNTRTYENDHYKSAAQVIKMLADVVSKNGNLLLSIPLRADGTFDDKEAEIVKEIGEWMNVNGEAIYSTRPWVIFGEGPIADSDIKLNAQGFNEGAYAKATSEEIRFTQTPKHLYAIALSWPEDGVVTVKSLGDGSEYFRKKIKNVDLVGYGRVAFTRDQNGLKVILPEDAPKSVAPVLRIRK